MVIFKCLNSSYNIQLSIKIIDRALMPQYNMTVRVYVCKFNLLFLSTLNHHPVGT